MIRSESIGSALHAADTRATSSLHAGAGVDLNAPAGNCGNHNPRTTRTTIPPTHHVLLNSSSFNDTRTASVSNMTGTTK